MIHDSQKDQKRDHLPTLTLPKVAYLPTVFEYLIPILYLRGIRHSNSIAHFSYSLLFISDLMEIS